MRHNWPRCAAASIPSRWLSASTTPPLHRDLAPSPDPSQRTLFDLCEEVRCEALGALHFPGVVANLVASQHERLEKSDLLNAHLASLIPLAEGLRMVLRDTLLASPDPSIPGSGFWMWDQWIRRALRLAPDRR